MIVADLDLDLEIVTGPFDLLLTLVLREEVDLLEVELSGIVLAYLDVLEERGELDLEMATEFIVLVAALLELKSRLMLPGEEADLLEGLEPGEAAEELLARMIDARRYRNAAEHLEERLEAERGFRYRSAPLPAFARRVSLESAVKAYEPEKLGEALGDGHAADVQVVEADLRREAEQAAERFAELLRLVGLDGALQADPAGEGRQRRRPVA
ncbi:MAG: segregation and condensation protein A, partial [Solirubrobacterales bacterium]